MAIVDDESEFFFFLFQPIFNFIFVFIHCGRGQIIFVSCRVKLSSKNSSFGTLDNDWVFFCSTGECKCFSLKALHPFVCVAEKEK